MNERNYYQMLGLSPQCTAKEIEAAYHSIASEFLAGDGQYNPDAQKWFYRLNQAYIVLANPERREQYDLLLATPGAETGAFDELLLPKSEVIIPVSIEKLPREVPGRNNRPRERRTVQTIVFIGLTIFLLITLALAWSLLSR